MAFINQAVTVLQTLVIALGAGLAVWGVVNLMEGYGNDNKPDEARERIVRLMGDLPRVELFARQSPEGWEVWGNEVECSITLGKEKTVNGICSGPEGS